MGILQLKPIGSVLAAFVATTAVATSAHAGAGEADEIRESIVYTDLDLGDAAGIAELDRRIERAVSRACKKIYQGNNFTQYNRANCRRDVAASVTERRQFLFAPGRNQAAAPAGGILVRMEVRAD